jgi:Fe-S cluster biogenesis protein NfuA
MNRRRCRLNDVDMRQQVERTIEVIRPALQADGGDVVLRDVDEISGVVTVELVGACGTCPVSTQTLKAGIERIMRDRVDGVTEVVEYRADDEVVGV